MLGCRTIGKVLKSINKRGKLKYIKYNTNTRKLWTNSLVWSPNKCG
jgi:hypothetical protein